MNYYEYEADAYSDPDFPLFFSLNTLENCPGDWYLHWHEATELLYCIEGSGTAVSDTEQIPLQAGDLAVINANRLHTFYSSGFCRYYCFILSSEFSASRDLPGTPIQPFISDPEVERQLWDIIREMQNAAPFYRSDVRARITQLYVYLYRNYPEKTPASQTAHAGKRLDMVKSVITYIRRNFMNPITIDDVCEEVSFSKSYICHAFKEITGQTLVGYINFLRCSNAHALLATRQYNVTECAEKSGFNTLSYFSKIYKKQMGVPPSAHL